ncbi:MAG: HlyD family efflux transporter periplasmic adaptor subunit [Glaciecola sp.]|nr:HlyD family efflux transporter periplasmic adaptor subunit [Glaciecola sp.]MDG1814875.1 HlyD family efflux transporter periplasmic adaptor subunit [Glaciecola sp.]MDG2100464.1 HlyD family efflux transporter periplasmic adaptor subunit [Glaciecola sp.]
MNNVSRRLTLTLAMTLILLLQGCGDDIQSSIPTYQVQAQPFAIEITATGEIEAAESQKIVSPGRRPMMLAWLAEENTYVKEGDVIARFDSERIIRDKNEEEFAVLKLQQDIINSQASQTQEKQDIRWEQNFVEEEFAFVDRFAIDDLRIYSQLDIIDTLQNRDFLEAKDAFLAWKETSVLEQHDSATSVLDIQQQGHQRKLQQYLSALKQLEVTAPYSGLLVYIKDRRGEKPSVGNTIFPGSPLAEIPNLENLQARLYVLADDAIDLAETQQVAIQLDAFPDKTFTGQLSSVSAFPREIKRGNPIKYYELTATINEQDTSVLKPGRKLSATINVTEPQDAIAVPLQSIIYEQEQSFVYLQQGDEFKKHPVTTGRKNLYFIEITSGLAFNDAIALSAVTAGATQ